MAFTCRDCAPTIKIEALNVTDFKAYLECPYRFYLSRVLGATLGHAAAGGAGRIDRSGSCCTRSWNDLVSHPSVIRRMPSEIGECAGRDLG